MCMTLTLAHLSLVHCWAMKIRSVLCSGHATVAGSSLAWMTKRFTVGTPIQENKSDIRGQVTPTLYSLSFSPDGSILASTSFDHTVCFWDEATGDPIRQHLQHDQVSNVRFSPSGESVASAGWDGKLYLWQVPWLKDWVSTLSTCVLALVPYLVADYRMGENSTGC